jgi:ribosomal protein S24E
MKAITIRGIEPEVAEELKRAAKIKGKSINRLVLDMIKKEFGFEKKKKYSRTYNDLDDLFGKWSQEEFQKISSKIDQERQIDPELWS